MSDITEDKPVLDQAPASFNFHVAVKEAVALALPSVRQAVIQSHVDKELAKLTAALGNAIEALGKARNEIKGFKPDVVTYNAEGAVATEGFSKDQADKFKAAKEKLAKLEEAVKLALNDNDYSKVLKLG